MVVVGKKYEGVVKVGEIRSRVVEGLRESSDELRAGRRSEVDLNAVQAVGGDDGDRVLTSKYLQARLLTQDKSEKFCIPNWSRLQCRPFSRGRWWSCKRSVHSTLGCSHA